MTEPALLAPDLPDHDNPMAPALTPSQQAQVDQAVLVINDLLLRSKLDLASALHRYVLAEFFGGSWERYQQGDKEVAFAALLEHPDLRIGRALLRELIRVGEQLLRMPRAVADLLTVEHHRALLPLADDDDRLALAQLAVEQRMTAKALAAAVRDQLPAQPDRPGRRAPPRQRAKLSAVHKALTALNSQRIAAEAGKWTPLQRNQVRQRIQAWQAQLAAVLTALGEAE